jgi:hypothetical protein
MSKLVTIGIVAIALTLLTSMTPFAGGQWRAFGPALPLVY